MVVLAVTAVIVNSAEVLVAVVDVASTEAITLTGVPDSREGLQILLKGC